MTDRKHRTRPPLTSRVWFFPTLIMLMPLVSRACTSTLRGKPDKRPASHEKVCLDQYDECVAACPPDEGPPPEDGAPTSNGTCVKYCYEQYQLCLAKPTDTSTSSDYDEYDGPTCDAELGYCGYDEYDYGEPSSDATDWGCETSDDYDSSDYDSSSSDWSCDSGDDYDSSDEGGGWDCSADNYDEGDSGDDGDWGEDWGERSPAGGDGIEPPLDLPH